MSLREEKKQQTEARILESAQKIFAAKGFKQTSISEISKDANVGAGTIYNYFPSKGALLLRIFSDETQQLLDENDHGFSIKEEKGLDERIIDMMNQLIEVFHHYSKAFWRDLFHVMTEEAEEGISLRSGLFGLDEQIMSFIMSNLKQEAEAFLIPVNPEEATMVIYGIVMMDTMMYIYNEPMTFEQFKQQMAAHVRFVFAGKLKQ